MQARSSGKMSFIAVREGGMISGGADRDRTDDLLSAIQALSQAELQPHVREAWLLTSAAGPRFHYKGAAHKEVLALLLPGKGTRTGDLLTSGTRLIEIRTNRPFSCSVTRSRRSSSGCSNISRT